MKKQQIIPLAIAGVLAIVAIILFINLMNKNNGGDNHKYTKIVVNYNNEKKEYTDFTTLKNIEIGENSFLVGSIEPERIILVTPLEVTVDGTKVENRKEIEVFGGKSYNVCITSDDCFQVEYSR